MKKLQSNNKSGYPGVNWYKAYGKWRARIRLYNKEYHLGYFDDIKDAIKARKEAEKKYFGEYACENISR